MICRVPLDACPACSYLLHGLPIPGRCPECGFKFDTETVVFKATRSWKAFIPLISITTFCCGVLASPLVTLLSLVMKPRYAALTIAGTCFATIMATISWAFFSRRRNRFVSAGPDGLLICNTGQPRLLPYATICAVAIHDTPPWIKQQGNDATISLIGVFASQHESTVFQRVISLRTSAKKVESVFEEYVTVEARTRAERSRVIAQCRRQRQLGGVLVLTGGLGAMFAASLGWMNSPLIVVATLGPVYAGIAAYLVGIYMSDPRRKKQASTRLDPTPTNPASPHSSDPPP